jgi:ATP-dependent protease HslVU (ClpYQ) peptidase subunit
VTTIVAVAKDGKVIIGADSQTTDGNRPVRHPNMKKMSQTNGWIIAGSGDATPCDILQLVFTPPVPTVKEREDMYRFMVAKFVPAMRECLEENNWKPDASDKDSGFSMLFAFDGEIFNIGDDYSVLQNAEGIYGIGSGSPYAMGALYVDATIEKALETAAKNDVYTSAPFHILEQKKVFVGAKPRPPKRS